MKKASSENDRPVYVAILRGINVGGRSLLRMEDLRSAFETSGFSDVKTVLASGNVLFRAPKENTLKMTANIERMLCRAFGRDIPVIVRPLDDLRALAARFMEVENTPGARLFVTFLKESAGDHASFAAEGKGYRILSVADGMICSVVYDMPGTGAVELMGGIEKEFGQKVTTRSWNTVARLIK